MNNDDGISLICISHPQVGQPTLWEQLKMFVFVPSFNADALEEIEIEIKDDENIF